MAEVTAPAMTRHVRTLFGQDDDLPTLIESAEAVKRMRETPGWSVVQRVLAEEVATIDRELDHGKAKEAADYAKQHGRRSALRAADEAAKAVIGVAAKRREAAETNKDGAGESALERMAV